MRMPNTSLTDRFLAAFNRIDAEMRNRTKYTDRSISISRVANEFSKITHFPHEDFLRVVIDLRNVLVHEKKRASEEIATPAEAVVNKIERIATELESPEKVEKRFLNDQVVTVTPDQSLKEVLELVSLKKFSQFPVVSDGKIIGLLTENGITRWLSTSVTSESMIEFSEVNVAMVLEHEEMRENIILVGRLRETNEVRILFAKNPFLEAAVITQAGKADQKPLGIITRWDLIESII